MVHWGMLIRDHVKRRMLSLTMTAVSALVVAYFVVHAVNGDRGFLELRSLEAELIAAEFRLAELRAERLQMADRARRLHVDQLDMDLLQEQAKFRLGLLRPNEFVLMTGE